MTNPPEDSATHWVPATDPRNGGYPGLAHCTTVGDSGIYHRDLAISMRDNTIIYADVRRPNVDHPVPILVAYGPYGKHGRMPAVLAAGTDVASDTLESVPFEAPDYRFWNRNGYAVAYVDPRGTWGSNGDAQPHSKQEALDGYDVVEWFAQQAWCSGRVGLCGVSYLAMTQYAIAALRPPHLSAINPCEGISDSYRESATHGGIPETQFGAAVSQLWQYGRGRRLKSVTLAAHPYLDNEWAELNPDLSAIQVPTFLVCSIGNHALHTRGTLAAFGAIASTNKWLDIHPSKEWEYFYSADNISRQKAFFDRFLRGHAEKTLKSWPRVRIAYRDTATTAIHRGCDQWPPPNTSYQQLYLNAATGRLDKTAPSQSSVAQYDPTSGASTGPQQAGDQRVQFTHSFSERVFVAGPAELVLWVSSPNATDMDIFVNLDKVDRDGRIIDFPYFAYRSDGPLAQGWLRASHRALDLEKTTRGRPVHSHVTGESLPADGSPVRLRIEIWPLTAVFHPGESVRLTVAGSDIRRWPAPELTPGHDHLRNSAPHVLYAGGQYDSQLLLPTGNTDVGTLR